MPLAHPFVSMPPPRSRDRIVRAFQARDGWAATHLGRALAREGFEMGEMLLSFPPTGAPSAEAPLEHLELPPWRPGDALVTVTRPALHDDEHGDRRRVARGHNDLEAHVLAFWRAHFAWLARSLMQLAPSVARELPEEWADRHKINFRMREGAFYSYLYPPRGARRSVDERCTAVFLGRTGALWEGGPAYFGIFGMDGTATLAWARALCRLPSELLRSRFLMVEFAVDADIPVRAPDLRWMDEWKASVVVRLPL